MTGQALTGTRAGGAAGRAAGCLAGARLVTRPAR